jgi:hypothetical protein
MASIFFNFYISVKSKQAMFIFDTTENNQIRPHFFPLPFHIIFATLVDKSGLQDAV